MVSPVRVRVPPLKKYLQIVENLRVVFSKPRPFDDDLTTTEYSQLGYPERNGIQITYPALQVYLPSLETSVESKVVFNVMNGLAVYAGGISIAHNAMTSSER